MATAVSAAAATPPSPSPTITITKEETAPKKTRNELETNSEQRAVVNEEKDEQSEDDPLPEDLRHILTEVARTGRCPWLSWNGEEVPEAASTPAETRPPALNKPSTPAMTSTSRHFLAQRRPPSTAYRASSPMNSSSPRKKQRNGLHVSRRRFSENGGGSKTVTMGGFSSGRKRPLYMLRTQSSSNNSCAGSLTSGGRTSGSEPDDSTQCEWDSEGTSTTTNSEMSVGERREKRRRLAALQPPSAAKSAPQSSKSSPLRYKTLRAAVRDALRLVLDDSYRHHGGYKLSPAEIRINEAAAAALKAEMRLQSENGDDMGRGQNVKAFRPSAYGTFMQRRKRLLGLLESDEEEFQRKGNGSVSTAMTKVGAGVKGPPFTIQRIAEVLIAPERYYKQTHKLCNCLEKLLLVTSPASAFGGSLGGDKSQSWQAGGELSELADERGRQDMEQRKSKRQEMSASSDANLLGQKKGKPGSEQTTGTQPASLESGRGSPGEKPEDLEAAAKASLRHKFDHIGHDPHGAVDRDAQGPNRGMATSPPPPSLGIAPTTMPPHGFVRHLADHAPDVGDSSPDSRGHHSHLGFSPSSILFSPDSDPGSPHASPHANHSIHLLQMHHAAALAGLPLGSAPSNLVIDPATGNGRPGPAGETGDIETEPGRSSASNSDVDSESDDFSLDDSASDRSDGSDFDSGSGGSSHYEPFTAARVMALNRLQQQRVQNRAISGLSSSGSHHGDSFRPPADSEYQSGDSIDSTLAEDSGGSDSSSSDVAD